VACESNELLLQGYLDGELDVVRAIEFEEHLKVCADCAAQLHEQQDLRDALRASSLYERAPGSLRTRIRAGLPSAGGISMQRRRAFQWLAAAAAIAITFFVGTKVIQNVGGQRQTDLVAEEIVASHIRSLQPGHLFDVQSTDQHTVKPWFDGRLDFAPPVVNLAPAGFPLVGGRLDYAAGRPVAALVYQRRLHYINVLIWPQAQEQNAPPASQVREGYNILHWTKDGMTFWAISDVATDDLQTFVTLLRQ